MRNSTVQAPTGDPGQQRIAGFVILADACLLHRRQSIALLQQPEDLAAQLRCPRGGAESTPVPPCSPPTQRPTLQCVGTHACLHRPGPTRCPHRSPCASGGVTRERWWLGHDHGTLQLRSKTLCVRRCQEFEVTRGHWAGHGHKRVDIGPEASPWRPTGPRTVVADAHDNRSLPDDEISPAPSST